MKCDRCTGHMKEITDFVYQCEVCRFLVDDWRHLCIFKVGPYYVTLFDDFGLHTTMHRSQITKGMKQVFLFQELPIDIDESKLNEIWKHHQEN